MDLQETEPEEEHSNQSSSGYGTPDEGPEKTEPSEEHSNQSSSGERTSNEKSEETEASEEHSNQSGSGQKSSNEESEETEPSVNAFYQFKDNLVRWFQSLGGGDRENSSDKVSNF